MKPCTYIIPDLYCWHIFCSIWQISDVWDSNTWLHRLNFASRVVCKSCNKQDLRSPLWTIFEAILRFCVRSDFASEHALIWRESNLVPKACNWRNGSVEIFHTQWSISKSFISDCLCPVFTRDCKCIYWCLERTPGATHQQKWKIPPLIYQQDTFASTSDFKWWVYNSQLSNQQILSRHLVSSSGWF